MDEPNSQSSVSLRLAAIQKRCAELMEESDELTELTLEDPVEPAEGGDSDYFSRG